MKAIKKMNKSCGKDISSINSKSDGSENKNISNLLTASFIIILVVVPLSTTIVSNVQISQQKIDKRVLAFYYNWYSPLSTKLTADTPLQDSYYSNETATMLYHLDLAEKNGIMGFITTWWGANSIHDKNFAKLLDVSKENKSSMEHCVYFESVNQRYNSSLPDSMKNIVDDIKYVMDNYGNHTNYLKVDGRPVLFLFNYLGVITLKMWDESITQLHNDGYFPYLIAEIGSSDGGYFTEELYWELPLNNLKLDIFDGYHIYNPVVIYQKIPDLVTQKYEKMVAVSRTNNKLACATVFPGYDDRGWWGDKGMNYSRAKGQTYTTSWNDAINADPDWILITTFNEYYEGTEIEPTVEYSDLYINLTKIHSAQFLH
jgi:Glycosyl hydrolase family 99